MGYRFPTEQGLLVMSIVAVVTMVFSMFAIYSLLLQMEFQKSLAFFVDEKLDFEEDDTKSKGENDAEKQKKNEQVTSRYRVSMLRRFILFSTVSLITLLAYLLLVRTDAPSWLAWIGMIAILLVLLHTYFLDEIRRKRLDRLFAILTLILLMAMAMHWTVYAQQQVANGQIHQGKARITGYDRTAYDQNKVDDTVSRTDLVVSWGGSWGCPNSPDVYCEAELKGALCQTEGNRFLEQTEDAQDAGNAGDEEDIEGDAAASENEEGGQEEVEGDAAANENADVDELEQENEELREENEAYKEEADAYEEYAEDLSEALEEEYQEDYAYYYDDDYYEDAYWSTQDWSSIWGDYACVDLFTFENFGDGDAYNATTPPGDDGWPFVNIYGNCKTCEAYIVDYFSTEHFEEIELRKKSARNYGLAAGLGLVITIIFAIKQRINPATDHEIELLSRHGTTSFA